MSAEANFRTTVDTSQEEKYLKMALDYAEEYRKQDVRILLVDDVTKQPLVGVPVKFKEIAHGFIFAAGWMEPPFEDLYRQLGVDWTEVALFWKDIEPTRGTFDFQSIDWAFGESRGLWVELRVYPEPGLLWDVPAWTNWQSFVAGSSFLNEYKQYVYEFVYNTAAHLRGKVKIWETQLEIGNWRRGGKPGPNSNYFYVPFTFEQALELTKIQAKAIRDAIPDAFILLGTSPPLKLGVDPAHYNGRIDPLDWTKKALSYGVDFDGVGIASYYGNGPPAVFYNYLQEFLKMGKPVYMNEAAYPAAPLVKGTEMEEEHRLPHWKTFDEETQALWAKYIIAYSFAFGLGIDWFPFHDMGPESFVVGGYPEAINKLGLVEANGHARQAYFVYQDLIRQFTTNGTGRTDPQGEIKFRGFAGNYSISVKGYEPAVIQVVEGRQNVFLLPLKKTRDHRDASELLALAESKLNDAGNRQFQSLIAKSELATAKAEYEIASEALKSHKYDEDSDHGRKALTLVEIAFTVEEKYRLALERQQQEEQQRQQEQQLQQQLLTRIVEVVVVVATIGGCTVATICYPQRRRKPSISR